MLIIGIIIGAVLLLIVLNGMFINFRLKRIGNTIHIMVANEMPVPEIFRYLQTEGYFSREDLTRCLDDLINGQYISQADYAYIFDINNNNF